MIKTITQHELVKLAYNEISSQQTEEEIKTNLLVDNDAIDEYELYTETKEVLDQLDYKPSNSTIDAILNYAKGCQ